MPTFGDHGQVILYNVIVENKDGKQKTHKRRTESEMRRIKAEVERKGGRVIRFDAV